MSLRVIHLKSTAAGLGTWTHFPLKKAARLDTMVALNYCNLVHLSFFLNTKKYFVYFVFWVDFQFDKNVYGVSGHLRNWIIWGDPGADVQRSAEVLSFQLIQSFMQWLKTKKTWHPGMASWVPSCKRSNLIFDSCLLGCSLFTALLHEGSYCSAQFTYYAGGNKRELM